MNKTAEFRQTFELMKNSEVAGIPGVICISSEKPGPVLGITVCTHGNEPAGLAIVKYLMGEFDLKTKLLQGTVYLVLNNIEAAEKYFQAQNISERENARSVHINMNRLPRDTLTLKNSEVYEIRRANELFSIWKEFTVGIDIHSTTDQKNPILISRGGDFDSIRSLIPGFPINMIISNIDAVQIGIPAFALYGENEKETPVFAIEAGIHEDPDAFECAATCAVSLLKNLKMIDGIPEKSVTEFREYCIQDSVMFEDLSWEFTSEFKWFEEFEAEQILARNANGDEKKAPFRGCHILPSSKKGSFKIIEEEMSFLSETVKIRKI